MTKKERYDYWVDLYTDALSKRQTMDAQIKRRTELYKGIAQPIDPKTGLPMKGGKGAPDHKGDCLGYVVHYLLSWCRELKPLYDVTLRRLYEARRARGADATELEVTSQIMSASKLKGIPLKQAPNTVD